MPKNLNYPLASFQKAYTLADAVDALGGNATVENCALKMQRKVSGGFMVIISSAQKFSLIRFEKSIITITEEYKLIKHSYTNSERMALLRKAFLTPQVFSTLFERFKGRELPIEMLDKILIREYNVEESNAGRVAAYFIDGLKTYGLLTSANIVENQQEEKPDQNLVETVKNEVATIKSSLNLHQNILKPNASFSDEKTQQFEIQLTGLGIESKLSIKDEEDLLVLEALVNKIRKALKNNS